MRTFHTKHHSGLELKGDAASIGRGSSHSLLQTGIPSKNTAGGTKLEKTKSYSCRTKWHAMIKNLNQGLEFMSKQNSNLNEMERALSRWRDTPLTSKKTGDFSFVPESFLYLQTILALSEERMFNHPLFGSGYETPIRIHLNLKGERFIQEVPVVPLLNQPGFQALAHSGGDSRRPSDILFDSCGLEFVTSLLKLNKNIDGMKRQLRLVEECNPISTLGNSVSKTKNHVSPAPPPQFSRFLNWANWILRPLRSVPNLST
jgi:hypothetical protein